MSLCSKVSFGFSLSAFAGNFEDSFFIFWFCEIDKETFKGIFLKPKASRLSFALMATALSSSSARPISFASSPVSHTSPPSAHKSVKYLASLPERSAYISAISCEIYQGFLPGLLVLLRCRLLQKMQHG